MFFLNDPRFGNKLWNCPGASPCRRFHLARSGAYLIAPRHNPASLATGERAMRALVIFLNSKTRLALWYSHYPELNWAIISKWVTGRSPRLTLPTISSWYVLTFTSPDAKCRSNARDSEPHHVPPYTKAAPQPHTAQQS